MLCVYFQAAASSATNALSSENNGGAPSKSNGKTIFTVADSVEQPKLKGQGRIRRSRFSIKKHLQKHGLAQPDSDSDIEPEQESELHQETDKTTTHFNLPSV